MNGNLMLNRLLLPDIRELIEAQDFSTLSDVLNGWLPVDLASLLSDLSPPEQLEILGTLNPILKAEAFEYLDTEAQQYVLKSVPEADAAEIVNRMSPDDRTALLEELPEELVSRILALLTPQERAVAQSLLTYKEDSMGRLMTPDYVSVRKDWTIKRVLDHVRTHGKDSETLNVVYVTDENGKLLDDLRIRNVLLAPVHSFVRDIMDNQFIALPATDDKRHAVQVFKKYDRTALPVVDSKGHLVGIVTIDDVIDLAEREATEDIQKIGGMEALDAPYLDVGYLQMCWKRGGWLSVLFVGEMLTATAMGHFEHEIAKAVVLALFVPLIISSGGNSGSQAATLIVRSLALTELRLSDWWRVFGRELRSGITLGTWLGFIGFLRIGLWQHIGWYNYGEHYLLVGITVWISLVGVVTFGSLSGSMLPFILRRLGFDPATSSAPFVATLVDVTGLIIYFTTAYVILRGTLL